VLRNLPRSHKSTPPIVRSPTGWCCLAFLVALVVVFAYLAILRAMVRRLVKEEEAKKIINYVLIIVLLIEFADILNRPLICQIDCLHVILRDPIKIKFDH
jgi:threonine/homoserine/homoserine lactone efflux protein